jgi:uncharacterized protein YutE (UPF0331/DUF86 family)
MDKRRIVSKIRELDSYLDELEAILPKSYEEYSKDSEKRRACERLLQISVECLIDICYILGSSLKIEIPSDEEDIISTLKNKKIISSSLAELLIEMKGFRNILVHKYGVVDDEQVYEILTEKIEDFEKFKQEILESLKDF